MIVREGELPITLNGITNIYEHIDGLVANNIIAHCNDAGVDINQAVNTLVAHNTIINTAGIVVRQTPASARIYGNLLDGLIRQRQGGEVKLEFNEIVSMKNIFKSADELNLMWNSPPENIPSLAVIAKDFCDTQRNEGTHPGAFSEEFPCK